MISSANSFCCLDRSPRRICRPPPERTREQVFGLIGIVLGAATPANVLIGPHQDKFCLVDLLYFGIVDSYYLERNTPPSRSCRYVVSSGAIERQQREPAPEFVVQRRAVGEVDVGQPRARQRRGLVGNRIMRNVDEGL